ncbi:MAG: methyltransferase [Anaerolineaceae bacterium]
MILRHASAFIAPFVVLIVLPWLILHGEGHTAVQALAGASTLRLAAGSIIAAAGLVLFILSVRMFILIGKGTIMPWDPTRHLITGSLYAYVRNPMILGVLILLLGEAVLFGSLWIALLALFFFLVNTVYFRFSEEPGLEKRFGTEYREYRSHVHMWIPRLKPWKPG